MDCLRIWEIYFSFFKFYFPLSQYDHCASLAVFLFFVHRDEKDLVHAN